jgi:hypothetical protein
MSATGLDVFDKTLQTTNSGSIKFPRRTVPTESSHGRCSWSCLQAVPRSLSSAFRQKVNPLGGHVVPLSRKL